MGARLAPSPAGPSGDVSAGELTKVAEVPGRGEATGRYDQHHGTIVGTHWMTASANLPRGIPLPGGPRGARCAQSADPALLAARSAIAQRDWLGAQKVLQTALADSPNFADYHNLYAYSVRKGPNPDMALVFKHYTEALRINPRHLDALEYMGEAYLSVHQPNKAKENLQRLDSLCFFGCEQYRELKQAIAAYEAGRR